MYKFEQHQFCIYLNVLLDYTIQLMMNLKSQWIFSQHELRDLNRYRKERYIELFTQLSNQGHFTKIQLSKFIYFMRTRKKQIDYPLKFEKVIYYAVALYRRYYLINVYLHQEPIQKLISAVYISLKLNQYDEGFIVKTASKWKQKSVFIPAKNYPHYGDQGYTQAELQFLSGIKFQTSLSKLIQPIESIYQQINSTYKQQLPPQHQHRFKRDDYYELIPQILNQLDQVYYHHSLMFLYQGSKLALAIMVIVLRKKNLSLALMGNHLRYLAQANMPEIESIIIQLEDDVDQANKTSSLSKMKLPVFKKPNPKRSPSPMLRPNKWNDSI